MTLIWLFRRLVGTDWIRYIAPFGETHLVEWTWFDIHVKQPVLQRVAKFLTDEGYNPDWS